MDARDGHARRATHGFGLRCKKSRSTADLCVQFRQPGILSDFVFPTPDSDAAPPPTAFFHALIWLACTPNRLDSSAPPLQRRKRYLRLKLCVFRVWVMACSLGSAIYRSRTLS